MDTGCKSADTREEGTIQKSSDSVCVCVCVCVRVSFTKILYLLLMYLRVSISIQLIFLHIQSVSEILISYCNIIT